MAADLEPRTPPTVTGRPPADRTANLAARWTNVVLGAWLFLSAFLWPHAASSRLNTWIVGALIAGFGLVAMGAPAARFVNTAAALWLFVTSLFVFPHVSIVTAWHDALVAAVVFVDSLIPAKGEAAARLSARRHVRV